MGPTENSRKRVIPVIATESPDARARLRLQKAGRSWVLVDPCPYCGALHGHSVIPAAVTPDVFLVERVAPCGRGRYRLVVEGGPKWSRVLR